MSALDLRDPRAPALPVRDPAHQHRAQWACVLLLIAVLVCVFGGFFAPYSPTETLGIPGAAPGPGHVLGLDFIGRDVFSRVLYGGRSTLVLAGLATVLTYVVGGVIGLVAGSPSPWPTPS